MMVGHRYGVGPGYADGDGPLVDPSASGRPSA